MSGTKNGNLKSAATQRMLYGEDYHKEIGKKGGRPKLTKPQSLRYNKGKLNKENK